jgi:hypothetical protein
MKLQFSRGNAKLDKLEKVVGGQVWTFSLLSGHTCPYAKDCLSSAVESDGKLSILDGPHNLFRCFSASQEVLFRNVYNARKNNSEIVKLAAKSVPKAAKAISDNLPKKAKVVRIHVGGDFQTKAYFHAWIFAACANPHVTFYAYTKSLPFWIWAKELGIIPKNFVLTASRGGWQDKLIDQHNLRCAEVVFSEAEAKEKNLEIDHDDSHAVKNGKSFALLLHGVQPKGTEAAKALKKLKGKGSYGKD